MKVNLLITLFVFTFVLFGFSQEKEIVEPRTHNHSLSFEILGGSGFNYALGYEYWYRKGLQGVGTSVGIGSWYYRRNGGSGKVGATINGHLGVHYTLGTWVGMRIEANMSGWWNPAARKGAYNKDGKWLDFPLTHPEDQNLTGDPVRIEWYNCSFDIGPYFNLFNQRVFIYPKFSMGYFSASSYFVYGFIRRLYWFPYGGLTLKYNFGRGG